jgi:Ca-activated chloride channel family protein
MTNRSTRAFIVLTASLSCVVLWRAGPSAHPQDPPRPTFRSSVALVPITAVVRDSRNRIVPNLSPYDFQVLESGKPRPIVDFRATDDAPVSVAVLFDTSGSMRLASNLEKGREVVEHLLRQMQPTSDEIALFTFERTLREEVPFTNNRARIRRALRHVEAWGLTSLYDAIAETAKRLDVQPTPRRAMVVITDGVDTSSALTAVEVSALATAIDVPVYLLAVVSPLSRPDDPADAPPDGTSDRLSDLASWTGGDLHYVTEPEQASVVTADLLTAMRQQYFLAIESATRPGWYPLEVRTKRRDLTVRARSGYFASGPFASAGPDSPISRAANETWP